MQEIVGAYPSDWAQTMKGLDDVEVPFTPVGEWSYAAAAMGFSAVFYFYASETAGGLDSFIDCLRDFYDTAGDGLSWLVSDGLLAKAGGTAALEPLGGEYALHRYPNGTIIRAGTIFELGNTEQDIVPALLPALHAILKPAYAPSFTELIRGDEDFTARWKNRFDRVR